MFCLMFFLFLGTVSVLASRVMMEGCPLGQFPCGNTSVCLPQVLQCNGHRDCKNGADEEHCGKYAHVKAERFIEGIRSLVLIFLI